MGAARFAVCFAVAAILFSNGIQARAVPHAGEIGPGDNIVPGSRHLQQAGTTALIDNTNVAGPGSGQSLPDDNHFRGRHLKGLLAPLDPVVCTFSLGLVCPSPPAPAPAPTPAPAPAPTPQAPTNPPPGGSYTVQSGDTCDALARSKGISLQQLEDANPGKCGPGLQVGDTLTIP